MDTLLLIFIVYVLLNLIAFGMYGLDKRKAKKDQWRTKESTLLLAAAIGPFGAVAGMKTFRHKTQKMKFKLVYVFFAIHVVLIAYLIYTYA